MNQRGREERGMVRDVEMKCTCGVGCVRNAEVRCMDVVKGVGEMPSEGLICEKVRDCR